MHGIHAIYSSCLQARYCASITAVMQESNQPYKHAVFTAARGTSLAPYATKCLTGMQPLLKQQLLS